MSVPRQIPDFALFGETAQFPDVVHCERISARAPDHGWRIAPHRHMWLAQLLHVERGGLTGQADRLPLRVADGGVVFVPPRAAHAFTFRPGTRGSVLSFPTSLLRGAGPGAGGLAEALSAPIIHPGCAKLAGLIAILSQTLQDTGAFRTAQAVGLSQALLSAVAELGLHQRAPRVAKDSPHLARLDALIAQKMDQGWRPSDYAAALSITTGHLSRMCRAATGRGASAYVEHALMEEACRLLAFTQTPVAEVGHRLGYEDPSYFSKRFRATRGLPPSRYRQRFVARD